ncbi:hypothetical protein [Rhodococcoides fascians]|uniref:hypothetical protein n=1 Tax=Rhodococcoides fascians TaxID=1828 RepID=UPI00050CA038|nr:hypothetical protein [Rhodococcus fascians]
MTTAIAPTPSQSGRNTLVNAPLKNSFAFGLGYTGPKTVTGSPFSRNGFADEARAARPIEYAAALRVNGAPPEMFCDGHADLPDATASGLDPKELYKVPYQFRHCVAGVKDLAEARSLVGKTADEIHASNVYISDFESHFEAMYESIQRLERWLKVDYELLTDEEYEANGIRVHGLETGQAFSALRRLLFSV